jgi:hypothetical protein
MKERNEKDFEQLPHVQQSMSKDERSFEANICNKARI